MNEWMGGPKSLFNAICEQSRKKKLTYKKNKKHQFRCDGPFLLPTFGEFTKMVIIVVILLDDAIQPKFV